MAVHIGKIIKEELQKQGIGVTTFGKKINKSRNVVYDIFERQSIDTALLTKISAVLKFDFFSIYSNENTYKNNPENLGRVNEEKVIYDSEFAHLIEKIQLLENEISHLKKIIQLLEASDKNFKTKKTKTAHK